MEWSLVCRRGGTIHRGAIRETTLDVNEDRKTIRTTTQRKPGKALYGVAARIIATGAIALPTVSFSFISRQHVTRRCPLLVLRLVLVYWRGSIPLLVVATIGICVLMLAVACLAIAVRAIVILVIAIPIIGVIAVACVVTVRRRISRGITRLRWVRVWIIGGHRWIVGYTAIKHTLVVFMVCAPVAICSN